MLRRVLAPVLLHRPHLRRRPALVANERLVNLPAVRLKVHELPAQRLGHLGRVFFAFAFAFLDGAQRGAVVRIRRRGHPGQLGRPQRRLVLPNQVRRAAQRQRRRGKRHGRDLVNVVLRQHAHLHVHGLQLLHEQLERVRHAHHAEAAPEPRHVLNVERLVVARRQRVRKVDRPVRHRAHEQVLRRVVNGNHARLVAHRHVVLVPALQHGLPQEVRRPVRNHAVALHFADAQAAVVRPPLHRLPRQHGARPARAVVDLVLHHVLEPHVVRGPHENLALHALARHAVVQQLRAAVVVAQLRQHLAEHLVLGPVVHERGAVAEAALQHARLAHQRLHQLPDRHARGERVRVDNEVRARAVRRKRHVLFRYNEPHRALLPRARAELVADARHALLANAHLGQPLARRLVRDERAVHHAQLPLLREHAVVLQLRLLAAYATAYATATAYACIPLLHHAPNHRLLVVHLRVFRNQAVAVQRAVVAAGLQAAHPGLRLHVANALVVRALLLLARLVHVVVRGAKEAAFE